MTASAGFLVHVEESLAGLGPVSMRRMFGGAGIFADGLMFGIVIGDVLFLKADAVSKAAFENEGLGPFVYDSRGKSISIGYWRAPERLHDDPDDMVAWARIALGVARRTAAAKVRPTKPR